MLHIVTFFNVKEWDRELALNAKLYKGANILQLVVVILFREVHIQGCRRGEARGAQLFSLEL